MNINELVKTLMDAKEKYYSGHSTLSDFEFDSLEEELKKLDPNNKYFSIVGVNIKGSNKIKHNHKLLSCAKGKTPSDVNKWLEKIQYSGVLIAMPKIDGLTGCVTYVNGKFSHMSTRGDGQVGQDISHLATYLNIPNEIPYGGVIDVIGEIHLPKNTTFETNGKPLRNIAAGLVNRKELSDDFKYLRFVAYNLLGLNCLYFFEERLDRLDFCNFETVERFSLKNGLDIECFYEHYEKRLREKWQYETDGIVLQVDELNLLDSIDSLYETDHHHHYNFALKPKSESAITTLIGINWDVSKFGYIIPVANFESIELGDKIISNATLNNYENVEKLDLHIGDQIEIENANEVIPFFKAKIESANGEPLLIINCPCCGSKLIRNGVHMQCKNHDSCKDQIVKRINDYCVKCEMDGVALSTIETLYENTFINSIESLYNLKNHYNMLIRIPGFGIKKIDNLLKQIEKSKTQTVVQFISRLGIESVGERAVKNLNIDSMEKFWNFNDAKYINGQSIIEFRNEFENDIHNLLKHITIIETEKKSGKLVCMTGKGHKGRKELIIDIENKGFIFSESISKELEYLICEDINGNSSKLEKARKLGIKLISYEDFFK